MRRRPGQHPELAIPIELVSLVGRLPHDARDVPITDDGLVALREQRRRQAELRLAAGPGNWRDLGDNGPLVFANATGGPLDPGDVSIRIHVLLAPIGLPRLRLHHLRHGYITLLIRQGVPILMVAKLAGHASAVMTLPVYGHVAPTRFRRRPEH